MSKRLFVIFCIVAAICVVVIPFWVISDSSGVEDGEVAVAERDEDTKELFQANCGTCHTLAAAGTDGVVGPNLDDRLAPGGNGDYDGNYTRVLTAVVCGAGNGRMPARILTGENAKEVAAFVAAYAGQLGEGDGPLVDTSTARKPEPDSCAGSAAADEGSGEQTN
ncbi:MAG TPA: c-type cytochrome [Solirubrobacterales bacterium]